MFKNRIILGTIIAISLGGYQRYTRPLSIAMQDPGEEMFALPQRTLPSAWGKMDTIFQSHDTTDTETEQEKTIAEVDKKLTYPYSGNRGVYSYGNSGIVTYIDKKNLITLISGNEIQQTIQQKLQQIDDMVTNYDIVVPEGSHYSTAIPRWTNIQAIVRIGSAYAYNDCLSDRITQCRTTYDILFRFSQKMKDGGTLIQTLIGSSMEGILLNHITYLLQQDPIKYAPLKQMLKQTNYIGAETSFRNTIQTEYRTYKNQIAIMDISNNWNTATMDVINIIGSNEGNLGTLNRGIQIFLRFVLPKSLLFNQEETDAMARYLHVKIMLGTNTSNEEKDIHDYWTGPIWSRPNMIGRIILEAITPKLTGIKTRLEDTEVRYKKIIE